jgi:hypothetical protein
MMSIPGPANKLLRPSLDTRQQVVIPGLGQFHAGVLSLPFPYCRYCALHVLRQLAFGLLYSCARRNSCAIGNFLPSLP